MSPASPPPAAAGPGREVLAVRYGQRVTSHAESYLNFRLYGEPDSDLPIDYYFWVITDPAGVFLIDAGFAPEVGNRRRAISGLQHGEAGLSQHHRDRVA